MVSFRLWSSQFEESIINYTSLTILWHGQGIKEQGKETHGVENFIDQNTAT